MKDKEKIEKDKKLKDTKVVKIMLCQMFLYRLISKQKRGLKEIFNLEDLDKSMPKSK